MSPLGLHSSGNRRSYESSDAIGLDSTHGVVHFRRRRGTEIGKFELYTVIVQDRRSMRDVPVAFLLTTNKKSRSDPTLALGLE